LLGDLVLEVTQIMEPQMAERSVSFRVESRASRAHLRGNRKALSGALLNLLENALQANSAGGDVRLDTILEGNCVLIRVRDAGPGMAPEVQERLFQPFFTTRAEGTGLGLAIARSVIDAHGGEITVQSAPGQGSTFCVRLPLYPASERSTA
jgi:two-component system sensor histidine kinase FlrB